MRLTLLLPEKGYGIRCKNESGNRERREEDPSASSGKRRERERERSWAAAHLPGSRPRAPPATFHGSDSPACFRRRRSFIHSFILDALYACIDENGISSFFLKFFFPASTIIIQVRACRFCPLFPALYCYRIGPSC